MFNDDDETSYLEQRIEASRAMAKSAANDCARMAHEALVERYERRLAALRRASPDRLATMPAAVEEHCIVMVVC